MSACNVGTFETVGKAQIMKGLNEEVRSILINEYDNVSGFESILRTNSKLTFTYR
jgi:hypothetical protein